MSKEYLGVARESRFEFADEPNGEGATFVVPYNDKEYNVFLDSLDLDKILSSENRIGDGKFISLPDGELPLLVWAKAIEDNDTEAGWDVSMEVQVASMSNVHEHRGILTVVGINSDSGWPTHDWWGVTYEPLPPLNEPQPGDVLYADPFIETTWSESSI